MNDVRHLSTLFLLLLSLPSCRETATSHTTGVPESRQPSPSQQALANIGSLESIFTKETSLSYHGYTITKLKKTISVEDIKTEVSYAVLKEGEKVVANFDGLYHPMGNATEFGLFSFLGGENKQLVVEQSIPRNWAHWIVTLIPNYRLIFDSKTWAVDGELSTTDVNRDGVFELRKTLTTFYDFDKLPPSDSPVIEILFVYDRNIQEYVPANQVFQDYALRGIDEQIKSLNPEDERRYLSEVVRILLRYIYAGKRDQGWYFYDTEYKLPNKDAIKSDVLGKLKNEPVYNFIYNR
jgi:hypothetical protein